MHVITSTSYLAATRRRTAEVERSAREPAAGPAAAPDDFLEQQLTALRGRLTSSAAPSPGLTPRLIGSGVAAGGRGLYPAALATGEASAWDRVHGAGRRLDDEGLALAKEALAWLAGRAHPLAAVTVEGLWFVYGLVRLAQRADEPGVDPNAVLLKAAGLVADGTGLAVRAVPDLGGSADLVKGAQIAIRLGDYLYKRLAEAA